MEYIALRIFYCFNIIVAGQISVSAIANPSTAAATTFSGAYPANEIIKLVGCLWLAITILSILGLWKPILFSPTLLIQFIYKGTWLAVVALPAMQNNLPYPKAMSVFFLIWVIFIPFLIPWKAWFTAPN